MLTFSPSYPAQTQLHYRVTLQLRSTPSTPRRKQSFRAAPPYSRSASCTLCYSFTAVLYHALLSVCFCNLSCRYGDTGIPLQGPRVVKAM